EEDPGYGVPDLGGPGGALVAGLARDRGDQHVAQVTQSSRGEDCARTGPRHRGPRAFGVASARRARTAAEDRLTSSAVFSFARKNRSRAKTRRPLAGIADLSRGRHIVD